MMITALVLSAGLFAKAQGITTYQIPHGNKVQNGQIDGQVTVDLGSSSVEEVKVTKSFYGADTHGFSELPNANLVTPLQLGHVKFGGSLHSVYNWKLNAYLDKHDGGIFYVSPLEYRLKYTQKNYKAEPMFQVNMLGWQPDYTQDGKLSFLETANAQHAANAITYINGNRQIGLKNVIMGNEPFISKDVHGIDSPSADEYIAKYIAYAVAMRAAQENITGNPNDIKLWGPEIATGWTTWQTNHPKDCVADYNLPQIMKCSYGNGQFSEFIPYFLSKLAQAEKDSQANPKHYKLLDYVTFHYYPLFRENFQDTGSIVKNGDGKQDVAGMLESVNLWDSSSYVNNVDHASPMGSNPQLVKKFQNWIKENYPSAKLAVTEFGIDSMDKVAYHPIVRPLYLADLVARLSQSGVNTFVNSFLQSGVVNTSWAMISNDQKTRLYQIYSLYSNNFLGGVARSSDSYGDTVNVYSVKNASGTNVFIVNKDAKPHASTLKLVNDASVETTAEIALPAWSLTVVKVPNSRSEKIQVLQYGANEMGIAVDPAYQIGHN